MVVTLNKKTIANQVSHLNRSPKPKTVLRDYHIQGSVVKNVPFLVSKHNAYEPYLLSGETLERVYRLLDENRLNDDNEQIIYYTEET